MSIERTKPANQGPRNLCIRSRLSIGQAGSGDTGTLLFSGSPVSRAGTPLTEERRLEPLTSVSRASVQANTKRVTGQFECAIRSGNLPIRSQLHHPPPCP